MRRLQLAEGRRQAIKRFVLQILNTSLAVIIALSFEGLVEWRRNRRLVATARAHMQSEILDNREDLTKVMSWLVQFEINRAACAKHLDAVLAHRASGAPEDELPEGELNFGNVGIILNATSRQTAEATGALGHMDYGEVKRYAEAYSMQQEFMRVRERLEDEQARIQSLLRGALERPDAELRELRRLLADFEQTLKETSGRGKTLLHLYERALGARP